MFVIWTDKTVTPTEPTFNCFDHNAVDYSLPVLFITIWIIQVIYSLYIQSSSPSAPNLSSPSLSLFSTWNLILYVRALKFLC